MAAETFLKKVTNFSTKKLQASTWDDELTSDNAWAELQETAGKIQNQLTESLEIVTALFTVMELLEILIDCLTFADLYAVKNWFDAGVIAGKGLVNTGFSLYYIIMEYTR